MPGLSSSSLLNYESLFVRGEKQVQKRKAKLSPTLTTQKYKISAHQDEMTLQSIEEINPA